MFNATLLYLISGDKVLLGLKKKKLGKNLLNGFGGKVEKSETVEEAAVREMREECGVIIREEDIEKKGEINFFFTQPGMEKWNQKVHVFTAQTREGEPEETSEMKPEWHPAGNLPYNQMWPDDKYWLPQVLEGKQIKGTFTFAEDGSVKEYEVEES